MQTALKARKTCRFRVGDIVKVAARPDNPCEVMVTEWYATAEEWVLFIIDKRTLKGEFCYDNAATSEIELVRRPSKDALPARNGAGGLNHYRMRDAVRKDVEFIVHGMIKNGIPFDTPKEA